MLKFLTNEESFQLLENRVFGSNVRSCPEELVAHGESIAKQCSGVPLGVELISGVLRGRTRQSEWKMVEDNVRELLININDPKSCLKFVEMSYGHLPEDMKACFLYCGVFPQGFEIPAWKLIRLWISEGLISSNLKGSPEDIAEYYLNDLINRNLVIVVQKRINGQVKTCRLHNMLHHFCKMVGNNGGLFQEVCEKKDQTGLSIPDLDTSRRLCIQLSLLKDFISTEPSSEHVRSFLCFPRKQKESERLSNIQLLHKVFPLIRVLDVESLEFSFTKCFVKLFHLRYISISVQSNALPTFFGKFCNLQTLIVNTKAPTIEIKAEIWNMLRLRHLHTNVPTKLPSLTTQKAYESSFLQTLSKELPESCSEDLNSWNVAGRQFQSLKYLVIKSCNKLEAVPVELADVRDLQEMTLENTKKAINSAKEIQRRKQEIHQEHMTEIKDKKKETETMESFKFKLTIFPPEMADCTSMQ
ncbi:putative late blight resistance protein -like protein R1C-3-like [Capsicum annuum]|nr:putative late blight resistance protein -like protein R1C-3-like [Capsicum annuum]